MQRDQAHRTNELLERIAKALEKNNKNKSVTHADIHNAKYNNDIPGFEGTLDALDVLADIKTITDEYASSKDLHDLKLHTDEGTDSDYDDDIHNDYLNDIVQGMNQIEFLQFHNEMSFSFASNDAMEMSNAIYELEYEECLGAIKKALFIKGDSEYISAVECSGFNKERKDELAKEYVINILKHQSDDYDVDNCDDDCPCKKDATPTSDNPDPANYGHQYDGYTYEPNPNRDKGKPALIEYLDGIVNDLDYDIRLAAKSYESEINYPHGHLSTKKDCILEYVTETFGSNGARYTDIIKFAYYLGAHNAPKYTSADRGYYACAFATRFGGHLIQGGKDQLVKGINVDGKERYFALSSVEQFTDYFKRIS